MGAGGVAGNEINNHNKNLSGYGSGNTGSGNTGSDYQTTGTVGSGNHTRTGTGSAISPGSGYDRSQNNTGSNTGYSGGQTGTGSGNTGSGYGSGNTGSGSGYDNRDNTSSGGGLKSHIPGTPEYKASHAQGSGSQSSHSGSHTGRDTAAGWCKDFVCLLLCASAVCYGVELCHFCSCVQACLSHDSR